MNYKSCPIFSLIFLISLFLSVFMIFSFTLASALEITKAEAPFLKGDYKQAIKEGEKLIGRAYEGEANLDDLYYILGFSYLKEGNILRSWDIFEIILNEFKDNKYKERAKMGLGDVYFLRGDYKEAGAYYQQILEDNPRSKIKAAVLYRLSQLALKKQETKKAEEYLKDLRQEFSLEAQAKLESDFLSSSPISYVVQVGAFSDKRNAERLAQKLKKKNYQAYAEENKSEDKIYYRVRIGGFNSLYETEAIERKLLREGYPTKIYP